MTPTKPRRTDPQPQPDDSSSMVALVHADGTITWLAKGREVDRSEFMQILFASPTARQCWANFYAMGEEMLTRAEAAQAA